MPPLVAQPPYHSLGSCLWKSFTEILRMTKKKCMAESAENYSLQIVSERFTNLAQQGEIRG